MKNTRKKLLVSSVAALLVSAMALSTATYAWFTTSSQAKASELSVKTIKSSELKFSSKDIAWTDNLLYNVDKTLKPASSANGTNWFVATAEAKGAYTAKADTITEIASDDTDFANYVFADQLNVINAGKAAIEGVTINFSLKETEALNGKYLRMAVVPVDSKDAAPTAANFKAAVYAAAADTANAFVYDTDGTTVKTDTITAKSGANGSITVGDLAAEEAKYYNLYIWFEGQDEDCKDANAGNVMPKIEFTASGTTAVQTTTAAAQG